MSDPQPAPLLWERRYVTFLVLLLVAIVALVAGLLAGSRIVPKVAVYEPAPVVTAQTVAPAVPAEVGE